MWIPDDLRGESAWQRFLQVARRFSEEVEKNSDCLSPLRNPGDLDQLKRHGAILTVESGAALGGKLEHIQDFQKAGGRMCTLTWNGATEIGRGVMAPGNTGLTPFGRQAVKEMEAAGILIDLTVERCVFLGRGRPWRKNPWSLPTPMPKSFAGHPRNLTDEQFEAIRQSGGAVGLNFFRAFLNDQPEKASMWDVLRHAEHFLSMGGEDALAMGGDWDGARLPEDMPGLASIPALYELFLKHYPPDPGRQNLLRKRRPPVSAAGIALTRIEKVGYSYTAKAGFPFRRTENPTRKYR